MYDGYDDSDYENYYEYEDYYDFDSDNECKIKDKVLAGKFDIKQLEDGLRIDWQHSPSDEGRHDSECKLEPIEEKSINEEGDNGKLALPAPFNTDIHVNVKALLVSEKPCHDSAIEFNC